MQKCTSRFIKREFKKMSHLYVSDNSGNAILDLLSKKFNKTGSWMFTSLIIKNIIFVQTLSKSPSTLDQFFYFKTSFVYFFTS